MTNNFHLPEQIPEGYECLAEVQSIYEDDGLYHTPKTIFLHVIWHNDGPFFDGWKILETNEWLDVDRHVLNYYPLPDKKD